MMIIGWLLLGLVGALIGKYKNRALAGFLFGFLLGPLGWLIVALGEDYRLKCPACKGVVNEGAQKCCHCGSDLPLSHEEQARRLAESWGKPPTALLILAAILTPMLGQAQSPAASPAPDYKALFESANDAAAKWKAAAETAQQEVADQKEAVAIANRNKDLVAKTAIDMRRRLDFVEQQVFTKYGRDAIDFTGGPSTPSGPAPFPQPSGPDPSDPRNQVKRVQFNLPRGQYKHLTDYGGPNEFLTFLGRDLLSVHIRIGTKDGVGTPRDIPLKVGFNGTTTSIYSDGYGCTLYWVETTARKDDEGTFVAEFQPGALYRHDK